MDAETALTKIRRLVLRTEDRGASPAEADTAARMVVKLLTKFPQLLQAPTEPQTIDQMDESRHHAHSRRWDRPRSSENNTVVITHRGILKRTESSVQLWIGFREVWLPRAHIVLSAFQVAMPRWLAEENRLV